MAESVERSVSGPMWHGPSLADLLGDVTAAQAAAHPVPGAHSIWELVLHMASWTEIVRTRLSPSKPPDPTPEMDWPAIPDKSAEAWRAAVERLKTAKRDLSEDLAAVDDATMIARLPGRDHNMLAMLHGIIEHDAYHGGQIALLKRALERKE
jgi:uncharacterized damage-inducible protein DinB